MDQRNAFNIIIGGFTVQGVGFLVSMMVYASYIYRLMTQKLPRESMRPGMFVSVGPSAFTAAGILSMAENISPALPKNFMGDDDTQLVGTILRVVASWTSLWIWGYVQYMSKYIQYSNTTIIPGKKTPPSRAQKMTFYFYFFN